MEIKGILFDKDGTLLVFEKTWRPIATQVIKKLMAHYHLPKSYEKPLSENIGLFSHLIHMDSSLSAGTNADVAKDMLKQLCWLEEEPFIELSTFYFNTVAKESPFYVIDSVEQLLKTLKDHNIAIGLSTADSLENATVFLEKTGLMPYFDYIGADDGIINPKPAVDYMNAFCKAFNLKPQAVAVAGDTMTDITFGKNSRAGLTIGVLTGTGTKEIFKDQADLVLDSVTNIVTDNGSLIWETI